jgi:amino acid adenylation domain-containing protein
VTWTIQSVFERQAATTPDSIALTCEGKQVTYSELNERANGLARHLQARGVGPEAPVALCLDRSIEMIVAILGVLKAGGYYVPLEPDQPSQRLAFILQDTGAKLILTRQVAPIAVSPAQAELIFVDALPLDRTPKNPEAHVGGENAAYAIYTSGSTGRPKGVVVTHANVVRLFEATREKFRFDSADVWTLFHSYAFDFSVWEIWGALFYGGRLVVVPYWVCRSPGAMLELLTTEKVTVMNQTPSAFRQLIAVSDIGSSFEAISLRYVIFGGEALDLQCLNGWFDAIGDERPSLVNMYGITETTVHVTYRRIRQSDLGVLASPIGEPISDLFLYLLDPNGQPVETGTVGELYVSGPGVARGYIGDAGLTAARFLPDPFVPGQRMYRSGDRARRLTSGELEYEGRIDSQVKIRGYRIEPREVQAVLAAQKEISNAAVVAKGTGEDKRLVAYYSLRPACTVTAAELKRRLSEHVQAYMLPSQFVEMAALPLTPNGKVDWNALPEPRFEGRDTGEAPQTEREERLAAMARRLLNLESLGCDEDLFDLGMHSLLAGRMAAEIRQNLSAAIGIKEIFEARSVRALADRVQGQASVEEAIPRRCEEDAIPLTWQQEQIWFLTKLAPGIQAYNSQVTLRLKGRLDRQALEDSLSEIVQRHEILRTTFHDSAEGPVQRVHEAWKAEIGLTSLKEEDLEPRIAEALRHVFDCSMLPLVKWQLYRISEEDHVLLHVEHHLVHDGWEVAVLMRELQEFYLARIEKRPAKLKPLPIQYADYAMWQRRYLSGETLARKLHYWEERLRDFPYVLELPLDHERPAVQKFRGGAVRVDVDRELYAALREFSRERKATLFVTMYAAFALLMARYSGQKRFVIGTGVANRGRREIEDLMGMMVNAVVMTTDLTHDPTFEELMASTQRAMLEDAAHHDTPFLEMVRHLKAGTGTDRNPLFQVLFAFHDSAVPVMDFAGLQGNIIERHNGTAKMDVNVVCVPRAEQHVGDERSRGVADDLTLLWEYNSDLFQKPTMERMVGHYLALLRQALVRPDKAVSEFEILSDPERERILEASRGTHVAYDREQTIWERFEQEAARHPEKIAILHNGKRISYGNLAAQAETVAGELARFSRGCTVGVSLPRGPEMVAGMLGILKAGGAYVPLPRGYPEQRLRMMERDAGVVCVLGDADRTFPAAPREAASAEQCGKDAAYVMYTSGSTGNPKGIVVPNRAVNNLLLSLQRDLIGEDDVVAQMADAAFDATIFEIWGTLLTGATLAVIDSEDIADLERLEAALKANEVTSAFFTTALFNVISEARPDALKTLRTVAFGGEKASRRAIERMVQRHPDLRLFEVYGPTECTCFSLGRRVSLDALTIGWPLQNYSAYVLDERRKLVPAGIGGELYIGGDGLALGYLGQPELTAARFVANPFEKDGDILYRTGDKVRRHEDGSIDFLGRLDEQVKIRGFRVEIGEIEAALVRCEGVGLAAVTVRVEPGGEKQLVAWASPASLRAEELRRQLQQSLPAYMIPARIVVLDSMPLTASGKIDRRALVEIPVVDNAGQAAVSPLAGRLTRLWEELLGVAPIGPHHDFFSLGGHSLLAVRLVDRVEREFGRKVPVSALFRAPTIAQLASLLEQEGGYSTAPVYEVQGGSGETPLFFFHGDWEGGLYLQKFARLIGEKRPFYAIAPHGLDGGEVPATVQAMAAERLEALLLHRPEGAFILGGYCAGGLVALEAARQLQERGRIVERVILLDSVADRAGHIPWTGLKRRLRAWRGAQPQMGHVDWSSPGPAAYARCAARYRLTSYSGNCTLIFTKDNPWEYDPELPWRRAMTQVEVRWVPGTHETAVTTNLETTAQAIRASLPTSQSPVAGFSIVIPTYRRPAQLAGCLRAIAKLDYPRELFETIVVDDGDGSARTTVDSLAPGLEVTLEEAMHGGPAAARNLGAQRATKPYLAFLDDDCEPHPAWLRGLAAQFEATPNNMVGGRTMNQLGGNMYAAASQSLVDYLYRYYAAAQGRATFYTSNNLAVPRARFNELGGFDVTFREAAGEDREFCWRWQQSGGAMSYSPMALILHSHEMGWRGFWKQHFNYGRAAFHFRRTRAGSGSSPLRMEPTKFYWNLLLHPFSSPGVSRRLRLSILLFVSQVANALGFFARLAESRREAH